MKKNILILLYSAILCTGCYQINSNANADMSGSSSEIEEVTSTLSETDRNTNNIDTREEININDIAGYFVGTQIPYYTGVIDEEGLYCIVKSDILDIQVIDIEEDEDYISWYLRGINKTNQTSSVGFQPAEYILFIPVEANINGNEIGSSALGYDLDGSAINMNNPVLFRVVINKNKIPSFNSSPNEISKVEIKLHIRDDARGQVRDDTLLFEKIEFPLKMED